MHEKCKENHPRQRIFRAINKSTQQFTTPKLTHNLFVVERLSWTAVALEKKIAIIFIILYKEKVMLLRHGLFKGQLISKCLYEIIVWTKIPTKFLIISALKEPGQKLSKFLVQTMIS